MEGWNVFHDYSCQFQFFVVNKVYKLFYI